LRWILSFFKGVLGLAEYAAHSVDEWLRFRSGDNIVGRVTRGVLGLLWFPIGWLARFYLVVLIEPGFNPVKAPLSIIAAKFVYPMVVATDLIKTVAVWLGDGYFAWGFTVATAWLLPDAITFLIWETKENWWLYRANRPTGLRPVPVGGHGETMKGLLKPGFHSGTVPRLYARLRAAEGRAAEAGDWRAVRANRQELQETATAVRKFLEREMVALLDQCEGWRGRLAVGSVTLATNAIRIEVRHGAHAETPLVVSFTQRGGWLMAGLHGAGWLSALSIVERVEFANALAGFYRLAAVDLVREQVLAGLPPGYATFELEPDRLAFHPIEPDGRWLWYDLTRWGPRIRPENADGSRAIGPELDVSRLVFGRVHLTLAEWEDAWLPTLEADVSPRLTAAAAALSLPALECVTISQPSSRLTTNGEAPVTVLMQRNGEQ
jgi:hypothetical protein